MTASPSNSPPRWSGFLVALLWMHGAPSWSSGPRVEDVSAQALAEGIALTSWRYLPGGDAVPELPPSLTEGPAISSLMKADGTPEPWTGCGWFQVALELSAEAIELPLALRFFYHQGASRTYVDGTLVAETGTPSADPQAIVPERRSEPIFFSLQTAGWHRLTIWFCNPQLTAYHRVGYPGGFDARLGSAEAESARLVRDQRRAAGRRGLYPGIFLSFALLHALLFAFRPESRENIYFAALCASLAGLAFLLPHKTMAVDPRLVFWTESMMNVAGVGFALFGVLFVHRVFTGWPPKASGAAGLILAAILVWGILRPGAALPAVFFAMLAGLLEMARTVVVAVARRKPGARIVGLGVLAIAAGFGTGLLANLGMLPRRSELTFVTPFVSVLVLIVTMSVYLSRRFALTQRDLEHQLRRVRELSREKLAQERRTHEEQVRRKLLEKEVERKAQELEEARLLQLSMLPQTIPQHPQLDIAAHMSTATEVGGDYYDFDLAEDGTLTLAIGDATGHGMRAGTMVTATKSLFNALCGDPDLVATVSRSNLALKRMNLRALNMALVLARISDNHLRIAAAGMPFPLIYRAASGAVESIEVGGMPLGSLRSFPYRAIDVELARGDTVLFMSDGFPERLDPQGEMLGYEKASEIFGAAAPGSAAAAVERLVEAGESWASGVEPDDDVTFVVVKVLDSPTDDRML